jgi:hypothetical protein
MLLVWKILNYINCLNFSFFLFCIITDQFRAPDQPSGQGEAYQVVLALHPEGEDQGQHAILIYVAHLVYLCCFCALALSVYLWGRTFARSVDVCQRRVWYLAVFAQVYGISTRESWWMLHVTSCSFYTVCIICSRLRLKLAFLLLPSL